MGSTSWAGPAVTPEAVVTNVTDAARQAAGFPPTGAPQQIGDVFHYSFDPATLTASQVGVQALLQVDNDADFRWDRIIATATGLFSVYLQIASLAIPLMSSPLAPIFGELCSGIAGFPFWLPRPYTVRRGSNLTATFNDRSGAPNTIQFALVGYKVS